MNVWTYLGLNPNHRSEDNVVQYVKTHEDVPPQKIRYPRAAQIKEDGVYTLIVITPDNGYACFGRTGQQLVNLAHLQPRVPSRQNQVVLIAELRCKTCSLETLSGLVNPKRVNPLDDEQKSHLANTYFVVHDMLWLQEFIDGISHRGYGRRETTLSRYMEQISITGFQSKTVVVNDDAEWNAFATECIAAGEEGAVGKDLGAPWIAGKQNEVMTKKVRGVDFDLLVTGIEEGEGKHSGMTGKLVLQWRKWGKPDGELMPLPADGCFDVATRKLWFTHPELIVGQIVHVHALQIGSKGSLRLPKVQTVRIDKTRPDL